MAENPFDIEHFWSSILSRDETLVCSVYATLSQEEKEAVISHLQRMASEPGWHPEQRKSAQVALEVLLQKN